MSRFSFRPQVESLDGRYLPSANPAISITDLSLAEGHTGQTAFVFTVRLSEASTKTVSVQYATQHGSARVRDGDFVRATGKLTFAPQETEKTIRVLVNGDTRNEGTETFFVNLRSARHASIVDGQGVGTILNDDSIPAPPPYVPPDQPGDPGYGYGDWYGYWSNSNTGPGEYPG